jgi:hypothetical protein
MASLESSPAPVRRVQPLALVAIAVSATLAAEKATAQDGSYGRFEGDLALAGELGVVGGTDARAIAARLGASYLTMAGVYAQFEKVVSDEPTDAGHRIAGGIELRPLFLARFVSDLERGPALLDLWLDSFGFALGAYSEWSGAPACAIGCRNEGLEFAGRMALPLLPEATGPFLGLRVGARFPLEGPRLDATNGTEAFGMLSLGYEHVLGMGLLRRAY